MEPSDLGHAMRQAEIEIRTERHRQTCWDMERQLEAQKEEARQAINQKQMELDSARKESQFKDAKLLTAEKEAELMRQEVQRLSSLEDALKRQCRENDTTIQQVLAHADQEKCHTLAEMQRLQLERGTLLECLEDSGRVLREKAAQDAQLRDIISELRDLQSNQRPAPTERQVKDARKKQEKAEKFAADMQRYAARLEAEIRSLRLQLKAQGAKKSG